MGLPVDDSLHGMETLKYPLNYNAISFGTASTVK